VSFGQATKRDLGVGRKTDVKEWTTKSADNKGGKLGCPREGTFQSALRTHQLKRKEKKERSRKVRSWSGPTDNPIFSPERVKKTERGEKRKKRG